VSRHPLAIHDLLQSTAATAAAAAATSIELTMLLHISGFSSFRNFFFPAEWLE
jgi:hypothetical protein